ncbi:MAG: alanine racemase [Clostridia bacterium]|nr:alanine racemase [Clostridia bacterium]
MTEEKRRAWVEVDLDALKKNFENIKAKLKESTKTMCVVKADAYGHGYAEVSKTLSACGADCFAVATIEEAVQMRKAGIDKDILILGYTEKSAAHDLVYYDITAAVFDYECAENLSLEAKSQGKTAKVHIKIDTGMTRIGYSITEEAADEIIKITKLDSLFVEGMFSHFSKADGYDKTYSAYQFYNFMQMDEMLKSRGFCVPVKHIANSAAIMEMPEYQLDMVRPGIILYGIYPSDEVDTENLELTPVMSIKAHIARVREVEKGTLVSYGGTYSAKKDDEKIATVPIGYADGYTRIFTGKTKMIAGGKAVPVVGRICMDQCMIDVSLVHNIDVGDEVIVMGKEGDIDIGADYLAEKAGTIGYEIVCMAGKRLKRHYIQNAETKKVLNYLEKW